MKDCFSFQILVKLRNEPWPQPLGLDTDQVWWWLGSDVQLGEYFYSNIHSNSDKGSCKFSKRDKKCSSQARFSSGKLLETEQEKHLECFLKWTGWRKFWHITIHSGKTLVKENLLKIYRDGFTSKTGRLFFFSSFFPFSFDGISLSIDYPDNSTALSLLYLYLHGLTMSLVYKILIMIYHHRKTLHPSDDSVPYVHGESYFYRMGWWLSTILESDEEFLRRK